MPDQDRILNLHLIQYGDDIITKPVCVVVVANGIGGSRSTVPATRDSVNVIPACELRSEVIEDVKRSAQPCQEHNRLPYSTPVLHLKPNPGFGCDERQAAQF